MVPLIEAAVDRIRAVTEVPPGPHRKLVGWGVGGHAAVENQLERGSMEIVSSAIKKLGATEELGDTTSMKQISSKSESNGESTRR